MADKDTKRILILGDPGSGKTTLFKAFGTGILQKFDKKKEKEDQIIKALDMVPFFIDLRHFSSTNFHEMSLFEYIVEYILKKQLKINQGESFLKHVLAKKKCFFMLDGLDEVSDEDYPNLLQKVTFFCNSDEQDKSTRQAKIAISCRRQNFLKLREHWIPTLFPSEHVLASFSDNDIQRFLSKRKSDFIENRSPEGFFDQIKSSGMIDLHRSPLILTISLSLYLNVPKYRIPNSIAKFYKEMIRELLTRHDFRTRPDVERVNQFGSEDKIRFLREFALMMAERKNKFDEFSYKEIRNCLELKCNQMANVDKSKIDIFIREIINHSGLLLRVSDEDNYVFAHRSIHEYFAALQLSRNPVEGAKKLISMSHNSQWRQIIVFFSSLDHTQVDFFIKELANANLELAGHCLSGVQILSTEIASQIINMLKNAASHEKLNTTLSALISINKCHKHSIQTEALDAIKHIISIFFKEDNVSSLSEMKRDDILKLLIQLSRTTSHELANTAFAISRNIEDDKDLIKPLWQILNVEGLSNTHSIKKQIIQRLLDLSMTKDGLDELQHQPQRQPHFLNIQLRRAAYPFNEGHKLDSNLVTLLAWADKFDVTPTKPNIFFKAKTTNKDSWKTVEKDSKYKSLIIKPYLTGSFLVWTSLSLSLIIPLFFIFKNGWQEFTNTYFISNLKIEYIDNRFLEILKLIQEFILKRLKIISPNIKPEDIKFIFFSLAKIKNVISYLIAYLLTGPLTILFVGFLMIFLRLNSNFALNGGQIKGSNSLVWFFGFELEGFDEDGEFYWDEDTWTFALFISIPLTLLSMLWLFILNYFITSYHYLIFGGFFLNLLCFWLPATNFFIKDKKYFIRKPNPFINIYEDPRSLIWIKVL